MTGSFLIQKFAVVVKVPMREVSANVRYVTSMVRYLLLKVSTQGVSLHLRRRPQQLQRSTEEPLIYARTRRIPKGHVRLRRLLSCQFVSARMAAGWAYRREKIA